MAYFDNTGTLGDDGDGYVFGGTATVSAGKAVLPDGVRVAASPPYLGLTSFTLTWSCDGLATDGDWSVMIGTEDTAGLNGLAVTSDATTITLEDDTWSQSDSDARPSAGMHSYRLVYEQGTTAVLYVDDALACSFTPSRTVLYLATLAIQGAPSTFDDLRLQGEVAVFE